MPKRIHKGLLACLLIPVAVFGREDKDSCSRDSIPSGRQHHNTIVKSRHPPVKVQFGIASYYADKFEGRKTYTDEIFSQEKLTGASNTLPMHTWVRVTNLRNHLTVIVQINDKMHPRNHRLIDLTRAAAEQLGYAGLGLTRVRVDVLGKKKV
jgi:rare lipoprotein A